MKFPDLKLILKCQCQQASLLASEALDRDLTFSERWAVRMHFLVCKPCRRVARQLRQLQQAARQMPDEVRRALGKSCEGLSPSAKSQIIESMRRSDS
ncbi:zf-HC2 domain-containing protein [Aeoliella sp.]|uniref:zf-HC2 domain-containing protein n=1 Tax=Aeoliella sp. TaxID=2795800 RepID=UPI003CCC1F2C